MSFHLSTKERLLLLIDDMELISKYVLSCCIEDVYKILNVITFQGAYRKFIPKTSEVIDGGAYGISGSSCGER